MTDFSGFFDGDQFANRPDHPDFWRLSEITLQLDGVVQEHEGTVSSELRKEVDERSATYMAEQHSLQCLQELERQVGAIHPILVQMLHTLFMAEWLQAFIIGSRFQQRGGKR